MQECLDLKKETILSLKKVLMKLQMLILINQNIHLTGFQNLSGVNLKPMPQDLFTIAQQQEIVAAIKQAEKNTSGEIRVHIEKNCKEDVLDHAAFIFDELEMQKTELRNGVLIYLAVEDRKLAILGDAGINLKVPKGFWDEIKDLMITNFKEGKFTEGLSQGIILAGEQLKKHYPHDKENDENELSDEISFGGNL